MLPNLDESVGGRVSDSNTKGAAEASLGAARTALSARNFDEAREHYQAVLLLEPANVEAGIELADLLLSDGAPLQAMQMLRALTNHVADDGRIWLRLALAVAKVGSDPRVTRRLFERAASLAANDNAVIQAAAKGLASLGQVSASEALLTRASADSPPDIGALRALATLRDEEGRVEEALAAWHALLQHAPNDLMALRRAAELHITREENAEATTLLERACALSPNDLKIVVRLGYALYGDGQYARAELAFARVLKAVPDLLAMHLQRGRCLVHLGRMQEAADHLRKVLREEPNHAEARVAYAAVMAELGREKDAERMLRDVLRRQPDHALANVHLAGMLAKRGDVKQAETRLLEAIESDPKYASAYFQGAWSGAFTDAERIETVLAADGIRRHDKMLLHFAASKVYDKKGDAEQAWAHAVAANGLKQVRYDADARERLVDRLIEAFPGASSAASGLATQSPIFIVGMPRSGTSLMERVLAAHPNVIALGERPTMLELARSMAAKLGVDAPYPDCAPPASDRNWRAFGEAIIEDLPEQVATGMRFTDKMPANAFHVGMIARVFPNARIIHTRRNLVDSCLSCWFTPFTRDHLPWSYALDDLAAYAKSYVRIMNHWRVAGVGNMLEVDYADLVTNPEQTIREVIAFTGLPWDDACLTPERADASLDTASIYQARRPIYASSVDKYAKYAPFLGPIAALESLMPMRTAA